MIISNRSDCHIGCLLTGFFFIATEIMNNGWLFSWGNTRRNLTFPRDHFHSFRGNLAIC